MSEPTILQKLTNIINEQFATDPAQVTEDAKFLEDLGLDSLDTVELVMAVEEEFEIEVTDQDAESCVTVGDAVRYIENKINKE